MFQVDKFNVDPQSRNDDMQTQQISQQKVIQTFFIKENKKEKEQPKKKNMIP